MNRTNRVLIVILVVQLAVSALVLWPRSAASGPGEALFPNLETGDVVALSIAGPGGEELELARQSGSWVLPQAGDYPVQGGDVDALLTRIAALQADRLVTQTEGSHKRMKVAGDDFERRITFRLADGVEHRLFLGTSPSFGAVHVRADEQDEVYLTSQLTAQDAGVEATAWVDPVYLSIPREEITAITLENENGTFVFLKEDETWALAGLAEGETLDQTQVTTLVNRASSVSMIRPLGREALADYGLDEPAAIVTVETAGGEGGDRTYTLRVGAYDADEAGYAVISSESPYYVLAREFSVNTFVEATHEGFLTPTPTPELAPTVVPEGTPSGP
jgi:hypothetical protein